MKAPFPLIALIAFLLLPFVAALESFGVPFVPHFSLGVMFLFYIFGGVIGTWLFDYTLHAPPPSHRPRRASFRSRLFHS